METKDKHITDAGHVEGSRTRRHTGTLLLTALLAALLAACADPDRREEPDAGYPPYLLVGGLPDGGTRAPASLSESIATANALAVTHGLSVRPFTEEDFLRWYQEQRMFNFTKQERLRLDPYLAMGQLPPDAAFLLERIARFQRVQLEVDVEPLRRSRNTIVDGRNIVGLTEQLDNTCNASGGDALCREEFESGLPGSPSSGWPENVPLRILETTATGTPRASPSIADALRVEFFLTQDAREPMVSYFAVGFGRGAVASTLDSILAAAPDGRWVAFQEVWGGWLQSKANTFPTPEDNEVCYGPARQFFNRSLLNGPMDRSTEALFAVLSRFYCVLPDAEPPSFGDVFHHPGMHAGRFMVRDPQSGRDVVFSVQSGGQSAYRFWWADEDFAGNPFGRMPSPEAIVTNVDRWRRCVSE